jgi:hypothetical protein
VSRPKMPVPEEIQALSRRVERWRRTRARRAPMPAELWEAAVAAARTHGVSAVVRGAGIGYASLRQRYGSGDQTGREEAQTPAGFVELEPMSAFSDLFAVPPSGAVVELRDGCGAQVTVRLGPGGREAVDVSAIVASLWRRESGGREA